jgi:DnaK suppressor protein
MPSRPSKPAAKKAKKATPKKAVPAKKAAPGQKRVAAKKAVPTKKPVVAKKAAVAKKTAKATPKQAAPARKKAAPAPKAPTKVVKKAAPAPKAPAKPVAPAKPAAPPAKRTRKPVLDKFLLEQIALLEEERQTYTEQAEALKAEADQLAQEMEPGDIQFDEESGEGGTMNVDRERDLALSAQARAAVEEIDHALAKIHEGTYGICENCGQPIPKARLKALPFARLCVACKSGGLSRR